MLLLINFTLNLKIYYQNVIGLKSKTYDFMKHLATKSYDVILLCETWLNCNVYSSELFDDRYVVYRRDRDNVSLDKNDGGGCIIAVKRGLFFRHMTDWEGTNDIWIAIEHKSGEKSFFNVRYVELGTSLQAYRDQFDKIS